MNSKVAFGLATLVVGLVVAACGSASMGSATQRTESAGIATIVNDVIPATPAAPGALPNPVLTPGDTFPNATVAEICVPGYATRVRDVPAVEKRRVYAEYGVTGHAAGEYEVDHLVPLELGGSNHMKNLWPQPATPKPGFHEKDVLETKLHDLACAGTIDLQVAQQAIATNWPAAYQLFVGGY